MKYNGSLDPSTNRQMVKDLRKTIKKSGVDFNFIAFRGTSGALLAAPLSLKLNKKLVNVRKPEVNSHGVIVEGYDAISGFIIVDDFIVSGATIDSIFSYIPNINCKGIFVTGRYPYSDYNEADYNGVPLFRTTEDWITI